MPAGFFWNDTALRAAGPRAFALAANDVRVRAIALCAWPHVKSTIRLLGGGHTFQLAATSRDAGFLEHGTSAHTEAPRNAKALKFKGGGFAKGRVPHPGTEAKPFIRPAAATLGAAFQVRGREVFPR